MIGIGVGITFGVIVLVAIIFLIAGLKQVQQQERFIIERFGRYQATLRPGLRWIIPGIERVRAAVSIWGIRIPLFEEGIKIDFADGSATPKGSEAYVQIQNPDTEYDPGDEKNETGVYRAIYEIENWRVYIRDLLENAIRSYLNGLTIDEGITQKCAGFDLRNKFPPEEITRITEALDRIGFKIVRITIEDFDLEPELVKARGEIQIRKRAAEAAQYERERRARETIGALIQMMAEMTGKTFNEVQTEVTANTELQGRLRVFSEEIVTRQMSIDGKALTDVRVGGAGDLETVFLRLIAAFRAIPGGGQ